MPAKKARRRVAISAPVTIPKGTSIEDALRLLGFSHDSRDDGFLYVGIMIWSTSGAVEVVNAMHHWDFRREDTVEQLASALVAEGECLYEEAMAAFEGSDVVRFGQIIAQVIRHKRAS